MATANTPAKAPAKSGTFDPKVEVDHAEWVEKYGPHQPGACVTCDQLAKGDSPDYQPS